MRKSDIRIIGARSAGSSLVRGTGLGRGVGLLRVLLLVLVLHEIITGCGITRATVLLATTGLGLLRAIALLAAAGEDGLRKCRGCGGVRSIRRGGETVVVIIAEV